MGRVASCGCRQHLNTPSVQTSPRKPAHLEHSREGPHRGPCGRPALWHNTEAIGCNIPHGQPCFLSSSQVLGSLRPRGRPGSRLWPGPALAIVAICGIDQQVQDLFSDFPINKFKKNIHFRDHKRILYPIPNTWEKANDPSRCRHARPTQTACVLHGHDPAQTVRSPSHSA